MLYIIYILYVLYIIYYICYVLLYIMFTIYYKYYIHNEVMKTIHVPILDITTMALWRHAGYGWSVAEFTHCMEHNTYIHSEVRKAI